MSFFNTREYQNLRKVVDRRKERNTLRNYVIYLKLNLEAIKLVAKEYNDTGWDKERGDYRWAWDFERNLAKPEFTDKEHYALFKKYWPEGVDEPDFIGMIDELNYQISKKGG